MPEKTRGITIVSPARHGSTSWASRTALGWHVKYTFSSFGPGEHARGSSGCARSALRAGSRDVPVEPCAPSCLSASGSASHISAASTMKLTLLYHTNDLAELAQPPMIASGRRPVAGLSGRSLTREGDLAPELADPSLGDGGRELVGQCGRGPAGLRTCAHISGESAKNTELSRARPALHATCRTPVRYPAGAGAPGPTRAPTELVSRTALALRPA